MAMSPVASKARLLMEMVQTTNNTFTKNALLTFVLSNKQLYRQRPYIIQFIRQLRNIVWDNDEQKNRMTLIEADIAAFNQLNPSMKF
jgi:hypothetical protein